MSDPKFEDVAKERDALRAELDALRAEVKAKEDADKAAQEKTELEKATEERDQLKKDLAALRAEQGNKQPATQPGSGQEKDNGDDLTLDDGKDMTEEEINKNWDEVQKVLASQGEKG